MANGNRTNQSSHIPPSFPPTSGIRDNYRRRKVADFLRAKIAPDSTLSVMSAYFTTYAFDALKDHLTSIAHLDFLFGKPRFVKALDPDRTEKKAFIIDPAGLHLANRLEQKHVARQCAGWIRDKADGLAGRISTRFSGYIRRWRSQMTHNRFIPFYFALFMLCANYCGAQEPETRKVLPGKTDGKIVPSAVMDDIYEKTKTPFKYGVVLKGEQGKMVDSPSVFHHGDKWYMMYICMNKVGYETHLAESEDLLTWKPLGKILTFRNGTWDAFQAAGYVALQDHTWGGTYQLQTFADKYWLSYLGGALKGYETDPLSISMAWTLEPDKAAEWTRFDEPVLTRDQPDVRAFEKITLYKSTIILDREESLGFPFVMFYNGKSDCERIGMAVSKDMKTWRRYGKEPVIDNGKGISGDPQITRIGDVWVMFYFGAFWNPKAFDTFACSYDLVRWTKWKGPHLVEPSEPWDQQFAHKPWMVKHDGVVYHFYCAVGNQGRVIGLATSKDMTRRDSK